MRVVCRGVFVEHETVETTTAVLTIQTENER
jgi:hypothetical protein